MKITLQTPTPVVPLPTREILHLAVEAIADRCDGAQVRDGEGFNRDDTEFGFEMAEKKMEEWTYEECVNVWRMLRKYHRQLDEEGMNWELFPRP